MLIVIKIKCEKDLSRFELLEVLAHQQRLIARYLGT